ncbi:MAG TPA: hypothetical protein VM368_08135, partial [Flavisolibacter sp.]|nr:hypothetical protein [Flavisolibacter sp.]
MNILDQIIEYKRKEVQEQKQEVPVAELEKGRFFEKETLSLKRFLTKERKSGIIAEYKRRSPSKGIINNRHSVEAVTKAYSAFGASGISILTDNKFFGGSLDDLISATDN